VNNIQQMFGGPGTVFSGSPITPAQTFNVAQALGLSGGSAMLVNGLMQSILPNIFGSNMGQFGQFMPQMNLYDQFRQRAAFDMQQQAMARGSALDQKTYEQMFRGFANLAGTPFGMREQMAAQTMAGDMAMFMPMLTQIAPDFVDRMHGSRGSAAVMAQRMAAGSRYVSDPVTGTVGMRGDTVKTITEQDQLNRRVGPAGPGELERTMQDLVEAPDFNDKVQQFEANRITDKIKAMSGAVAAMKDIFGENGRSDAPMAELFNALQAITQNNLSSMNPADVERMVRNAANMSKMTGMGLDAMMANIGMAGQAGDRYGLNRAFATGIATNSAAFAQAYATNFGGATGFNLMDKEKALAFSREAQAAGLNSPFANSYAALIRMSEAGVIDPNKHKEVADYIEQVKAGTAKHMRPEEIGAMLNRNGIRAADFFTMTSQRNANQAVMFRTPGLAAMSEAGQVAEAEGMIASSFVPNMVTEFGLNINQAGDMRKVITEGLMNMTGDEAGQFSTGNYEFLVKKIKDKFPGIDENQIRLAVSKGAGSFGERAKGKGNEVLALVNTENRAQAARNRAQAEADSRQQSAFAKLNRGTPMQRFADVLLGANKDTTIEDALFQMLGGVGTADLEMAEAAGIRGDLESAKMLNKRAVAQDEGKITAYLKGNKNLAAEMREIETAYGLTPGQLDTIMRDKDGKPLSEKDIISKLNTLRTDRITSLGVHASSGMRLMGLGQAKTDFDRGTIGSMTSAAISGTAKQAGSLAMSMAEALQSDVGMLSMMGKETADYITRGLTDVGKMSEGMDAGTTAAGLAAAGRVAGVDAIRREALNLGKSRDEVEKGLMTLAKDGKIEYKDILKNVGASAADIADLDRLGITKELQDARAELAAAGNDPKAKEAALKKLGAVKAKIARHAQSRGYAVESVMGDFKSNLTANQQAEARKLLSKQKDLDKQSLDMFSRATRIAEASGGTFTVADVMGDSSGAASEMIKDVARNLGMELGEATRYGLQVMTPEEMKKEEERIGRLKEIVADPGNQLNKLLKQLDPSKTLSDTDVKRISEAGPGVKAAVAKTTASLDTLTKLGFNQAQIQEMFEGKNLDNQTDETKRLVKGLDTNIMNFRKTGFLDMDKFIKSQDKKAESSTEAKPQVVRFADGTQFSGTMELTTGAMVLTAQNP